LQETLSQQQLLAGCLERHDSGPSTIKDMTARIAAFGQSVGGMAMADEVVKGGIAGYVFEQTETAVYTALIAAAKSVGDTETVQVCEQILPQEVEMGRWLLANLPDVVTTYLARSAEGMDEAKH